MGAVFATPWGLLGLVALPLIWWLQKRLRRPPDVELPSLMFLLDEEDARALPRGRLLDAELLLALAAAALLAFAAADPVLERAAPRAVVRVAVSGGSPAARRGTMDDVRAALATLRDGMADDDVLDVTWVPAMPSDAPTARPRPSALLATAQAGVASRRIVLSDVAGPAETAGVVWIARGHDEPQNTGIAALRMTRDTEGARLFVTLVHQGKADALGRLVVRGATGEVGMAFRLPRDGYASYTLDADLPGGDVLTVALENENGDAWTDDLGADDRVRLERGPLRVHIAPTVPAALAARVRAGLAAALGTSGFVDSDDPVVAFGAAAAPPRVGTPALTVLLAATAADAPLVRAPAGPMQASADPLVRDLAAAGGDFAYARGTAVAAESERVLLGIADGERTWPVLVRNGAQVRLVPVPMRGTPPLVDAPFWPLFLENVIATVEHGSIGEGWRARGLLDASSSRTGQRRDPLDRARLGTLEPALPGARRSLRTPLIVGALLCLAILWAAPRLRRRLARRANPHAGTPAGAATAR